MGLLEWMESVFKAKKKDAALSEGGDEEGYVSKDLFYKILDLDTSIVMFFTKDDGWIGANKAFFETFNFKNIDNFREKHESIREIFSQESEEIFTEYDRSWLEYIRQNKPDGYGVVIKDKEGTERMFLAQSRMIKQNGKELYVLELDDVSDLELARKQTYEVERLKTKFLAMISL